ncbi:hypothetical protein CEXT_611211 [Caerostris extrusa]|uniref:Uncharacterized protein n=1 Tax=Caerostris extrusa TaxID=172846 RepID=A0AAV4N203_CAEEX|nr:hypothetical protein CEXT_611211 [Caerostris extrusa]
MDFLANLSILTLPYYFSTKKLLNSNHAKLYKCRKVSSFCCVLAVRGTQERPLKHERYPEKENSITPIPPSSRRVPAQLLSSEWCFFKDRSIRASRW